MISPAPPHAIEPELTTRRLPRSARFTWQSRAVRVFLANLAVGATLGCVHLATRDLVDLAALKARGAPATAEVTATEKGRGRSHRFYLHYVVSTPGRVVAATDRISRAEYEATRPGDERPVTYLPGAPDTFRLGRVDDARIAAQRNRWGAAVAGAAALFGGVFALVESDHRKHLRLLRDGIPVVGRVIESREVRGKTTAYYLTYRFELMRGAEFTKKIQVGKRLYDHYEAGVLPEWTVLYDPADPKRNLPYRCITAARLDAAASAASAASAA